MHNFLRTDPMFPDFDFRTDRAAAPLVGFVLAAALSASLWATVGLAAWALLH